MRILGITETCDLGALYLSLIAEGHEVRISVSHPMAQATLSGLVDRTANWRNELNWIRQAGLDGLILFESVSEGLGELQDELRRDGFQVVGGSAYGDRLENDRLFAQEELGRLGFSLAQSWNFSTPDEVVAFIDERPARYVLKRSGAGHSAADTYIGQLYDGRDVVAVLRAAPPTAQPLFLMEFVDGVEMGVGAYFNGQGFIRPACLDWEHKHFFPGDQGELTGEMGTVVTYDRTEDFFNQTLALLAPALHANGHVGYVNLNTIVNSAGIWPLEFTCRFGYPGFAILSPLQATPWCTLLHAMGSGRSMRMETHPGFCVGVLLTTPPFPYSREEIDEAVGLPVLIEADVDPACLHFGEVGLNAAGHLVTTGLYGWTMVVTGTGSDVSAAQTKAYQNIAGVFTPNARYRRDIGDRLKAEDLRRLELLGIFGPRSDTSCLAGEALPHDGVYARLGVSGIHGIGVFAIRAIPKGTDVFANDLGELVWIDRALVEVAGIDPEVAKLYRDFGVVRGRKVGVPVNFNNLTPGWCLNEPEPNIPPNVEVGDNLQFIAARDIAKGEELTVVYAAFSEAVSVRLNPKKG